MHHPSIKKSLIYVVYEFALKAQNESVKTRRRRRDSSYRFDDKAAFVQS